MKICLLFFDINGIFLRYFVYENQLSYIETPFLNKLIFYVSNA